MKKVIKVPIIFFIVISFLLSCKKTVIVVPDACLSANKTTAHISDSVTFTNCSTAELTQIMFFKGDIMPNEQPYYQFNENGKFNYAFNESGTWTALVRAINKNAPVKESRIILNITE